MRRVEFAQRVLLPAAAACWLAALLLASTFVSWWLSLVLLIAVVLSVPLLVRVWRRRLRLAAVRAGSVADGWAEVLDESLDRGVAVPAQETVRAMAGTIANDHGLDTAGRDQLRKLVAELERSWYAPEAEVRSDASAAVTDVLNALCEASPMSLRARYWPRSVLTRTQPTDVGASASNEPAST
jgi:hypothetical protein